MSKTRGAVRLSIYEILGDMNPDERVVSIPRINEIIARNYQTFLRRTTQHTSVAVSVTVLSGTGDYTIDSNEVFELDQVFDSTNNRELFYLPLVEFNSRFLPDVTTAATGLPTHYTTYEGTSQVMKLRLGPTPNASLTVKCYRTTAQSALTTDGSSLLVSDGLARGIEAACAADILAILGDAQLTKLGASRAAVQTLRKESEDAIREHNLKASRTGRRQASVLRHARVVAY